MEQWAFFFSVLAFLLAAGRWVADILTGNLPFGRRSGRHEIVQLAVELLAGKTNCFILRGGYSLIFVSLRVYNRSQQRSATVSRLTLEYMRSRRWIPLEPFPATEADIFGSLVRNALPVSIEPLATDDVYEVYQLPDLIQRPFVRIRVQAVDYSGSFAVVEDVLPLRLDSRPPLDILFQTLDIDKPL